MVKRLLDFRGKQLNESVRFGIVLFWLSYDYIPPGHLRFEEVKIENCTFVH